MLVGGGDLQSYFRGKSNNSCSYGWIVLTTSMCFGRSKKKNGILMEISIVMIFFYPFL